MAETEMVNVPAQTVRAQCEAILRAWGMSDEHVKMTAGVLLETDLRGIESHGMSMLPIYNDMRGRKINMTPNVRVVKETPVSALIDADNGIGHIASTIGMGMAIAKAKAMGLAVVCVRRSAHFGAAGCYSDMAARAGMIGIVTTSARGITMVPTHGTVPVFGTNPISVAAPAGRHEPFNLDMATTPVAVNKLKVYWLKGKELPEGWAYNEQGGSERNAERAFKTKRMAPLGGTRESGGHKGYGLAMVVNILSQTLAGTAFQPLRVQREGTDTPDNIGHFFLVIDPKLFREEGEFESDLDEMMDFLRGQVPSDPAQPVLVPGDPEYAEKENRLRNGIPVPRMLADQIRDVCRKSNAAYLLEG